MRAPDARMTCSAARCTSRCHASITQPGNRKASSGAVDRRSSGSRSDRADSRGRPNRFGTRWSRCPTSSTHVSASSTAWRGSTSVNPTHSASRRDERCDLGRRRGMVDQRLVRALDQVTERDRRRAGGLAAEALHAGLDGVAERVVERRAVELDRPHGRDPAPRGQAFEPGDAVGRAVRQAESAGDAGRPARPRRPGGCRPARAWRRRVDVSHRRPSRGRRPGAHFPVGSNATRTRSASRALGRARPNPSRPGAPASRSSQPPAASAVAPRPGERALVVGRDVHGAHTDLGEPANARGVERIREPSQLPRVAPRCVRGADRRATSAPHRRVGRRADPAALGVDVGRDPLEQHVRRPAVPRDARRPVQRAPRREGIGRGREPLRGRRSRLAAQRDLHEHADGAERSDQQAGQVEPAHVLHRGPAGLHDAAVGGHEAHLEHAVAERSETEPSMTRQSRWRARPPMVAAGSRGSSAHSCPAAPRTSASSAHGRARADGHREVGGVVDDHAVGCGDLDRVGVRRERAPDLPVRAAPHRDDRRRARGDRARRGRRARPSTLRCISIRLISIRSRLPRARAAARRSGCPAAGSSAGWRVPTGRTRRGGAPARRGRRR